MGEPVAPAIDLTRIPVTTFARQIVPAMGNVNISVYNEDITTVVWVSYSPSFPAGATNAAAVQPLTNSVFNAQRPLYAVVPSGSVMVTILPADNSLNPSPGQVAAQIGALGLALETTQAAQPTTIPAGIFTTGVPLYSKSTVLLNSLNHNLGAGAQASTAILSVNQIGYNIFLLCHETAAGGTPTNGVEFNLIWFDSTTGQIVGDERWNIFPSSQASGLDQICAGVGPTKGDQLQVFITNNDTIQINYGLIIELNSRVYVRDDIRCLGPEGFNGVAGQTRSDSDLTSLLVGSSLNNALAAGATETKIIPLICGRAKIHWDSSSNAADCEMIIRAASISRVSGAGQTNIIFDKSTDATGNGNEYFTLPRGQCTVGIKNNNAAAKTVRWVMTLEDY